MYFIFCLILLVFPLTVCQINFSLENSLVSIEIPKGDILTLRRPNKCLEFKKHSSFSLYFVPEKTKQNRTIMRVEYSTVIDAPVDKVWQIIRVYAKSWDPESPIKFELTKGSSDDQVGCNRTITLPDNGGVIVERLEALDDRNHRLCYSIVSAPFPCTGYVSEYQAWPVTDGNKTFVRWFSEFEPNKEGAEGFNFEAVFTGIYSGQLGSCKKLLANNKSI